MRSSNKTFIVCAKQITNNLRQNIDNLDAAESWHQYTEQLERHPDDDTVLRCTYAVMRELKNEVDHDATTEAYADGYKTGANRLNRLLSAMAHIKTMGHCGSTMMSEERILAWATEIGWQE